MIEKVKQEKTITKEARKEEKTIEENLISMPKNIRQIGQVCEGTCVYIEDYVISFVRYLGKEATQEHKIAILLGEFREWEGKKGIFISGAIEINGIKIEDCGCFSKDIWEGIYHIIEENYTKSNIVGWAITKAGMLLEPSEKIEKVHIDNFAGKDKVLMFYDTLEREERFYLFEGNHLKEKEGYCIYYEKNQEMQNYMLNRKGNVEQEAVDDTVIKEMRKKMENMQYRKKTNKRWKYMKGTTAILAVLTVVALGKQYGIEKIVYHTAETISEQKNIQLDTQKEESVETEAKITISQEKIIGDKTEKKNIKNEINQAIDEKHKKSLENNLESIEKQQEVSAENTRQEQFYIVQPGDTMVSICMKQFQSLERMDEILEINGIQDRNKIVAGQKLKLWE